MGVMELERKLKRPAVAATPAHALHEREFEYQKSTKKTPQKYHHFDVKMCICGKMHFLVYWKIALLSTHQVGSSFGNYYLAVNQAFTAHIKRGLFTYFVNICNLA